LQALYAPEKGKIFFLVGIFFARFRGALAMVIVWIVPRAIPALPLRDCPSRAGLGQRGYFYAQKPSFKGGFLIFLTSKRW
jgi:hypothetical protein